MKKTLLLMFLLVSMGVNAQSELYDAIKDYVKACPSTIEGMESIMKPSMTSLNKKFMENYSDQCSEALIKKYCEGPFIDEMIKNLMIPSAEGIASVSDFQALTKAMLTPEGKTFQTHLSMMSATTSKLLEQKCVDVINMLIEGKTPPAEKIRQEIPQSYRQQYYQFYKVAKVDESIVLLINAIANNMNAPQKRLIQKYLDYLYENFRTVNLNRSYDYLTTADLNFGIENGGLPEYQHVLAIQQKIPEHAQKAGMIVFISYIEWLNSQGVALKKQE